MAYQDKVHALILSRRDLGEADRIVTLLTRELGLVRVLAKGVRKIPSRRGGSVEPLTQVVALLSGAPGRRYLAAVEPLNQYSQLYQSGSAIRQAQALNTLIVKLLEEDTPYQQLFDAIEHAWHVLPQLSVAKRYVLEVSLGLYILHWAGVAPQLRQCQVCSVTIPQAAVVLTGQEGGWRCLTCHDSFEGTASALPPRLLRALQWLARYPERALQLRVTTDEGEQLAASVRQYVAGVLAVPAGSMSVGG